MNKEKKSPRIFICILIALVLTVFVFLGLFLSNLLGKNKLSPQNAEEVITERFGYTKIEIAKKTTLAEVDCFRVRPCITGQNDAEYIDYYVFSSNAKAEEAFQNIEKWFEPGYSKGENYYEGWEQGVYDASVMLYIYLSDNVILRTEVSYGGDIDYGDNPPQEYLDKRKERDNIYYYCKEFINKNF